MKKTLIGIGIVLVVLVAAVLVVPWFIPMETYKQQITAQVRAATGRDLSIAGDVKLALLPRLEVEARDVSLSNAPGAKEALMASLAGLQVQLKVLPLLSGEVQVDRFVLLDPVIHLEVDKDGRPNWVFDTGKPAATKTESSESGGGAPGGALADLRLGDVRLENGTVTYRDARTDASYEVTAINMSLSLPALDQPLVADGSLAWNGKTIALKARAESPRKVIEGGTTKLEAEVKSDPVSLSFVGSVTNAQPARVGGTIDLAVPSIRALAAWVAKPIELAGTGLGPLSIKGRLDVVGQRIAFTDASIGVDEMKASGALKIDTGRARPVIEAKLDVDRLDLNPYLPPQSAAPAAAPSGSSGSAESGAKAPPEWSDDPIDLSGLRAADADLRLTVGGLVVRKIQIGRTALAVRLKDGRLVAELEEMALYDGNGTAKVMLDGSGAVPAVENSFSLTGVQAQPLLRDAAGFDRLTGTAEIKFDIATRGKSQRALVGALGGSGSMMFRDGAIIGVNLAAMVRNVTTAFLTGKSDEVQKTDFAELSGTFRIKKGVVANDDLTMNAPLLRLAGAGTASVPARTVNYRLEPKVVASLEGQGGGKAAGITVPVIVEGPWHDLSYRPDLGAAIGAGVKKTVEGIAKGGVGKAVESVAGKGVGKAVEGVTGGVGKLLEGAPKLPVPNPLGGIKKLFGD